MDAVGTLIYPDPPVAAVYSQIGRRFGSRKTQEEISAQFAAAFRRVEETDRTGPMTTSEERERRRWHGIVTSVLEDLKEPDGCFEALFAHFGRPEAWTCYKDVADALVRLEGRGYRLALASNFDARLLALCRGIEPLGRLQPVVISSAVGYRKPHRRFFEELVRQAGCAPAEILHVGDDYANDHRGALGAGLASVWLRCDAESPDDKSAPAADRVASLAGVVDWLNLP